MLSFKELGLSPNLLKGIEALNFRTPTPIQAQVIPHLYSSAVDLVGLAQTGTGKTAAFGLPVIDLVDTQNKNIQYLILSPTRELGVQIANDLQNYSRFIPEVTITAVYGGASIEPQIKALKKGSQIVVATPGRMLDMINRKAADLSKLRTLILDEADEMLNMGFKEELDKILEKTPTEKQTLLFSATMSKEVSRISKNYLREPVNITIGKQNAGAENIRHIYYQVHARDRFTALQRIADINPDIYGLVFCRTRMETREVAEKLIKNGYNADALHGDLSQAQRDQVMKRFRSKSLQMLVATDVAARGLDVDDITHVINYNLPDELDIYTHRSGRTGRAHKSGVAISIVNYREKHKIAQIEKLTGQPCEKQAIPSGEEICERQLMHMADRMVKTQVNEESIAPFIETVNNKLQLLSKEEIIKHFISLEFNRFLDYYKNAPDLNKKAEDKSQGKNKNYRERKNNLNGAENGFSRFFINIGKKDGIAPKKLIGLINDYTQNRHIKIGDIDLKDSFSFFEISQNNSDQLLSSFRNKNYKGRKIVLEQAERKNNNKKKNKHKSKKH